MKKSLKIWSSLIYVHFLFPIVLEKIPREIAGEELVVQIDERKFVYAANIIEMEREVQTGISAFYTLHIHTKHLKSNTIKHDW
ncbi:hypothetical protein [Sporosarcina sp. BP05]|uniref:hypothetical protein n=1 Tax=Sporosarcina sp. BP05 TaxID=2758726 RepID=UPI00164534CD|nr:hypothetical protein [Sporosarcina sp. BP05]